MKKMILGLFTCLAITVTGYSHEWKSLDFVTNIANEQPAPKADPSVTMPEKLTVKAGRMAQIEITYDGADPKFVVFGKDVDTFQEFTTKPNTILLRVLPYADKQEITVIAWCVKDNKSSAPAVCKITVGKPDPGPGPDPDPDPTPTPTPAPIPLNGLSALIIYESAEMGNIPSSQRIIIQSEAAGGVLSYLRANCTNDPSKPDWKAWRVWDKDTPVANEHKVWQDAMARKRDSMPWLIISNPNHGGGYEGPLPKTTEETLTLLKKFGGK